jgi:hypothetical protein
MLETKFEELRMRQRIAAMMRGFRWTAELEKMSDTNQGAKHVKMERMTHHNESNWTVFVPVFLLL